MPWWLSGIPEDVVLGMGGVQAAVSFLAWVGWPLPGGSGGEEAFPPLTAHLTKCAYVACFVACRASAHSYAVRYIQRWSTASTTTRIAAYAPMMLSQPTTFKFAMDSFGFLNNVLSTLIMKLQPGILRFRSTTFLG